MIRCQEGAGKRLNKGLVVGGLSEKEGRKTINYSHNRVSVAQDITQGRYVRE